jgi:hypothetical protein
MDNILVVVLGAVTPEVAERLWETAAENVAGLPSPPR